MGLKADVSTLESTLRTRHSGRLPADEENVLADGVFEGHVETSQPMEKGLRLVQSVGKQDAYRGNACFRLKWEGCTRQSCGRYFSVVRDDVPDGFGDLYPMDERLGERMRLELDDPG